MDETAHFISMNLINIMLNRKKIVLRIVHMLQYPSYNILKYVKLNSISGYIHMYNSYEEMATEWWKFWMLMTY